MVDIARKNLFHDRTRFIITVVGVTFSVVLIFSQFGIYLGFMENASIIIDNTLADIWVTSKNSANFDFAMPFAERKLNKVRQTPGVVWADTLLLGWGHLRRKDGGQETIALVGFNPETGVGGPWRLLAGDFQSMKVSKTIIVDESAYAKLGVLRVGDQVEINEQRVRVAGISQGVRGFTTAPYVFTSYRAAGQILDAYARDRTAFIVVRVTPGADPHEVAARLREIRDVDVYTRAQYSWKTRLYWTWETGIGVGFGLTVLMAIIVGVVIVSQTIYSATIEHLREFGTLKAIGATNRDVYLIILKQALINALIGYVIGLALTLLAVRLLGATGMVLVIPFELMAAVFGLTMAMCATASVVSVRKALSVDPLVVFRS
jgi:putative ABC transport system permease protein